MIGCGRNSCRKTVRPRTRLNENQIFFAPVITARSSLIIARMRQNLQQNVDLAWFDRFFGARSDADFHLVLGLCTGGSNYGTFVRLNGRMQLYAVIGAWRSDEQGIPQYTDRIVAPR